MNRGVEWATPRDGRDAIVVASGIGGLTAECFPRFPNRSPPWPSKGPAS
jgi:hypothetical protein